jgi:hypothetical protein
MCVALCAFQPRLRGVPKVSTHLAASPAAVASSWAKAVAMSDEADAGPLLPA